MDDSWIKEGNGRRGCGLLRIFWWCGKHERRSEGGGSEMDGGWLIREDEEETRWAVGGAMGKHGWDG